MNWLDVFCFISAARTRSFSVTARELAISQQAVSRHIQNLETETGLQLFLRNYHEIHLTKAGEQMLHCLVQRENMMKSFKEDLRDQTKVLRVAWSQWLGCPDVIRDRIRAYCEDHPDVTVLTAELDDREVQDHMARQRMDLLITTNFARMQMSLTALSSPVAELPLFMLKAKGASSEDTIPVRHIAAPVGTETQDALERRIRAEYAGLGMHFGQLEMTDNPRSVYLNVLLQKGTAFTVSRRILTEHPRFELQPLERTVTVVLCRPFLPKTPRGKELEDFILKEKEAQV